MPLVICFIFKLFLLSMKISGTYVRLICLIGKDLEESGCGLIFIHFPPLFEETEKKTQNQQSGQSKSCALQSVICKILLTRHYASKIFVPKKRSYKYHLEFQNANISRCSYIYSFSDILHFQNCLPSYLYFLPVSSYKARLAFRCCLNTAFFLLIT